MKNKILMIGSVPPPMAGQPIAFKALIDNLPFEKIIIDQSNTIRFIRPIKTLWNFLKLIMIFIFIKPQIIYFQSSRTRTGSIRDIFVLFLKNKNAKVINHLHGADFKSFYYSLNKFHKRLLDYAYSKIDISIVLLEKMKEQYEMFPKMNIVSIPNFYPSDLEDIKHTKTNLPISIVYLSNIMYSKGIIDLLDAVNSLNTHSDKIELTIAGKFVKDEFKSENEIKKLFSDKLNQLKSSGFNIKFYEGIYGKEKIDLLQKSDIFILPTFYKTEAFPISILEAMRTGNIIISTKHNYIEEIICDNNGKLINIRATDELAKTIIYYLNNIEETERIKYYNQNYARENYSTEQHVNKVEQIINSLTI